MAVELNMVAVFMSAVVSIVLGSLWYSPAMFQAQWLKLAGITDKMIKEAKKKSMTQTYAVAFVSNLLMAYVLGYFVDYVNATTFGSGVVLGSMIWVGFFATSMLSSVLWEGKPVKLYMINTLYYLVNLSLMAGLQATWV